MKKKTHPIVYVISAVIIIGLAIGIYYTKRHNAKIINDGIRVNATVIDLYKEGMRKNITYLMKVSMFLASENGETKNNIISLSRTNGFVDSIFDKNEKNRRASEFQTATISISIVSFNKHKLGDKVQVAYLKEKPEEVLLVEEFEY